MALSLMLLILSLQIIFVHNQSLPIPVTSCDINYKSPVLPRIACSESCKPVVDTSKRKYIYLYNTTDEGSIKIADCKKFRISQKFTKTWTFSEILGPRIVTPLRPTLAECQDAWEKQCSKGVCGTKEPEIAPEYHWASDTSKEIEYISIDAYQETFHIHQGDIPNVLVHGHLVPAADAYYLSLDQYTITLWTPITLSNTCPWTSGTLIQCIVKYGDTISLYCPTQGLTLDNVKTITEPRCPGQKLYTTGHHLMFRDKLDSDDNITLSRYLQLPIDPTEREWIMMDSINEALQTRDYLECMQSCLSFDYTHNRPQVFGTHLFLLEDNSTSIVPCNILPNCKVVLPIVFCQNPKMILVDCTGTITWWNATGDYTLRPTYCAHQESTPATSVTLSTINGQLFINKTGVYTRGPSLNDSFVIGHLIDPNSIISSQDSAVIQISQTSVGIDPIISSNITIPHPGVLDTISGWWEDVKLYLSHEIRVLLVVLSSLLFISIITLVIWKRMKYGGHKFPRKTKIRVIPNQQIDDGQGLKMVGTAYVMEDDE